MNLIFYKSLVRERGKKMCSRQKGWEGVKGGAGWEGDRERKSESQAGSLPSTGPHTGLHLVTWREIKNPMPNKAEPPTHPWKQLFFKVKLFQMQNHQLYLLFLLLRCVPYRFKWRAQISPLWLCLLQKRNSKGNSW